MFQHILTPYFLDEPRPQFERLRAQDWCLVDTFLPEGSRQSRMGILYDALADEVAATIAAGKRPVSIAGDCCASLGVLAGLQRAGHSPYLIWLDAHGDFNDWTTTPSGFLGGMPLAMAVGRGEQTIVEMTKLEPWEEAKVVLTDARDLDPGERVALTSSAIVQPPEFAQLPRWLPPGPLYVHFDVDIIDPSEAPAMNYPAPGGPSSEVVREVLREIAATGRVVAVSVSLWEFSLDEDRRTEALAMSLLQELLDEPGGNPAD